MMTGTKPLTGKRIGIFGKGGSGKSTCAVLMAQALAECGYRVCVLDADSTNMGIAEVLGLKRAPSPLLDWFGGTVFSGGRVGCPVDDPVPLHRARVGIHELPREHYEQNADNTMLFSAGKMGALGPGGGCDGPMTKIARDFLKAELHRRSVDLVGVIREDSAISQAWLSGTPLKAPSQRAELTEIVKHLQLAELAPEVLHQVDRAEATA